MDLCPLRSADPDLRIDLSRLPKSERYTIRSVAVNAALRVGNLSWLHSLSTLRTTALVSPELSDALLAHAGLPGLPVHHRPLDHLRLAFNDEMDWATVARSFL